MIVISCIIPIIRNDPHIKNCIEALNNSIYKDFEIIIVDEGKERSAQRNIGINRAKGKYLIFIDSDMLVEPELLGECIELMENNPKCIALYIPEKIVTPGWFGKFRDWERQFYNGSLVDVCRVIRKEISSYFDETLYGVEDSDWERRIPLGLKLTTRNHFNHFDKCGIIKYLKKKAYYAQCLGKYKAKHPNDRLLTFRYRCIQVFMENGKWKRLIRKPHYTLGVMLLLLARGVIYLCAKKS
jgi:glycosyltransferase involved in cell wall biosynthesis